MKKQKVKREFAGYYIYYGNNFTVGFNEDACETVWWQANEFHEVNENVHHLEQDDFDEQFERKCDLVGFLKSIDNNVSREKIRKADFNSNL